MTQTINEALNNCIYFTVKKIDRALNKVAEQAFGQTGLAPTYGFIILILEEKDGLPQKDIANNLHIAPSTMVRFVDKLRTKGYVRTETVGRESRVYLTEEGREFASQVNQAWEELHVLCDEVVGHDESMALAQNINQSLEQIEKNKAKNK